MLILSLLFNFFTGSSFTSLLIAEESRFFFSYYLLFRSLILGPNSFSRPGITFNTLLRFMNLRILLHEVLLISIIDVIDIYLVSTHINTGRKAVFNPHLASFS